MRRDRFRKAANDTSGLLTFLADTEDIFIGDLDHFFAAPASLDSLADLYERNPTATIVAGATDVGLWITKQLRDLPKIIHIGRVRGFDRIEDTGYELLVGGAATYAQAEPHFRDASIPISANSSAASAPSRCGRAARSSATSPTARRSATRRRH